MAHDRYPASDHIGGGGVRLPGGPGAAGYLLGVYLVTSTPNLMAEASGDFVQNPLLVGGVSSAAAAGVAMALLAALARVSDALLYCAVADEARGAGYY